MGKKTAKLYSGQRLSLNEIQQRLGLDKMYLYRYVGNHEKIKKMPYSIVLGIAKLEVIEPNELYNKMLVHSLKNQKKGDD